MKLNLFLAAISLFAVLHLSKAGPLRLQKRAAFYIANETACVVDNIVYSNGDPIPTDDPCEACKCRPPGFACVLKDCKAKPGCKAVRRVGQCCPEYVCDVPERNQFPGGNGLPPLNLLPALNDESVLPADFPSVSRTRKPTEVTAEPTQPPTQPPPQPSTPSDRNGESLAPDSKEPTGLTSRPQTTDSVNIAVEDSKVDPEGNEEEVKASNEDSLKDKIDFEKEYVKVSEETRPLFNSETEIKKEDSDNLTEVKIDPTKSSVEEIKEKEPQTTVSNEHVEAKNEEVFAKSPENEPVSAKIPEDEPSSTKIPESEPASTKIPESEPVTTKIPGNEPASTQISESENQVKNSAAENAKSLKLSDEPLKESQKDGDISNVDKEEKTVVKIDETVTESELCSETHSEISSESKPVSEGTQTNAHTTPIYSSDKIKSESAETVTIVVHVKEKSKPSTEEGLVTEKATPKLETSTTQDNLLKSNDKLQNTGVNKESATTEVISTDKNFEIFAGSSEINLETSTTTSPLTEQPKEKPEKRSDETDSIEKDLEENTTSEEKVLDLKIEDDASPVTTAENANDVTEVNKEVDVSEVVEEIKASEPTVTVIKIDPDVPLKIEIITDFSATPDSKEQTKDESKNEETKSEEIVEVNPEIQDPVSKQEEKVEEINVEAREDEITPEVKLGTTPEVKVEETTPEVKLEETPSTENVKESPSTENVKESPSTEKLQETTTVEKIIEISPGEKIEVTIPAEKVKEYASEEKLKETKPLEKVKESEPVEKLEVTTSTENLEKTSTENVKEFTIAEKIKKSTTEERTPETESKETTEKTITKAIDITEEEKKE